jgi:hypothetical protein
VAENSTASLITQDAADRFDPTGTSGLRRKFRSAALLRLRQMRASMRTMVMDHDVLALGGAQAPIAYLSMPVETRMKAFHAWLDSMAPFYLGGDWANSYVTAAWRSGGGEGVPNHLIQLMQQELEGIAAALTQIVSREAARVIQKRMRRYKAATTLTKCLDVEGVKRLPVLVNTIVVKAHNQAKLALIRSRGERLVGIIPEHFPADAITVDVARRGYIEEPIDVGIRTAGDNKVCIRCEEYAAGAPYDIDEVEDALPLHPSCLPGYVNVSTSDRISAVSKRLYDGDLVVVRTARGDVLEATPNHPILTNNGWLPIGALDVGSHVIGNIVSDGIVFPGEDNQYVPAKIEDVANALGKLSRSVVVPTTASDFHGDVTHCEVDIVLAEGKLWNDVKSAVDQHLGKRDLIFRDVGATSLAGFRRFYAFGKRSFSSLHSLMSRLNLSTALPFGHMAPFDDFLFGGAASSNVVSLQNSAYQRTLSRECISDFHFARQAEYAISGSVGRDYGHLLLHGYEGDESSGVSLAASLLDAGAPLVEVIHVSKRRFSGHVYNLQTDSGYYTANNTKNNGIVVKNCRCSWFPWHDRRFRHDAATILQRDAAWEEQQHPRQFGRFSPKGLGEIVQSYHQRAEGLEKRARDFAIKAHAEVNQRRKYTGEPYIGHPEEVVGLVRSVPHTPEMLAAAWLHDTVEDTNITHTDIQREFGDHVSALVWALTDEPAVSGGPNRAMRKQATLERLSQSPPEAQTIKYADIIANSASIRDNDPKFWKVYQREVSALLEAMDRGDATLRQHAISVVRGTADAAFDPQKHPHGEHGHFASVVVGGGPQPAEVLQPTDSTKPDPNVYRERAAQLVMAARIVRDFSVLEEADRSMDASTVYIDMHTPKYVEGVNTDLSLAWHELSEWLAMNDGWKYNQAHADVANILEREEVERQGGNWDKYQEAMGALIEGDEREKITSLPADLDIRVYSGAERKRVKWLIKAGLKKDKEGQA